MPDTRTGHRALDTGRADVGHVPDVGHWTDRHRTDGPGHTDAYADADRATKAQWASGHPDTRHRWDGEPVLLWAARAAPGNHDGSAVRPPCQRETAGGTVRQLLAAPPGAKRRFGALLSSE
jgi:hypothetical protein